MHAKGFDTHLVGDFKRDRTENAEGLRTFRESPFRRTTTANPRHIGDFLRMGNNHLQFVLLFHITGDINGFHRTANVKLTHMVPVQGDVRIGSHPFETEEILLSGNNSRQREFLPDFTFPMKVTMLFLQDTIIVIKVKGHIAMESPTIKGYFPIIIQGNVLPVTSRFGSREVHLTFPHETIGSDGYATLSAVIHRTIKMIHRIVPVHHITLMCEHLIVGFGRDNQICTCPVLPVHKVTTHRKSIESIVFA